MLLNIYFIYISITLYMLSCVQMKNADTFTRAEYLGLWYPIREMVPKSSCYPVIDCPCVTVRIRGYNNWKFQQIDSKLVNNIREERSVRGTIIHNQIHLLLNPDDSDAIMNVTKYENGNELIVLGAENRLLSRTRSTSFETLQVFRRLAHKLDMMVIPFTFDMC